eukprot:1883291-Rhodomonas_salina.1
MRKHMTPRACRRSARFTSPRLLATRRMASTRSSGRARSMAGRGMVPRRVAEDYLTAATDATF